MPFALLAALALQCFLYTGVVYVVVSTLQARVLGTPAGRCRAEFLGGGEQQRSASAHLSPRTDI
jgi:hypothetical protein